VITVEEIIQVFKDVADVHLPLPMNPLLYGNQPTPFEWSSYQSRLHRQVELRNDMICDFRQRLYKVMYE
jgi:hypothetical protein